jgi:hypothetical protein
MSLDNWKTIEINIITHMVDICYYSTNRDLVKIGLVIYKSPFYTFICVLGFKTEMGYSQNFFIFDGVRYR